jgi:hypothetical protein
MLGAVAALTLAPPSRSFAADAGVSVKDAGAKADASAMTQDPHAGLLAPVDDEEGDPHGGDPHAHAGHNDNEPLPDTSVEDPSLPAGTVTVDMLDANDKPLPKAQIVIGVVRNSVQKGESREKILKQADDNGRLRLENLETGTGIAYRITSPKDGATFAVPPFQLPQKGGIKARLHVYPVVHSLDQAKVFSEGYVVLEMKDDRVQMHQAMRFWNIGKNAWVPDNLVFKLPEGYTAFNTQQGMTDVGVDNVDKVGARFRGTIGPGKHEVEFMWQMPYGGESDVTIDAPMPPHMIASRIVVPASGEMKAGAEGYSDAKTQSQGGQKALVTEREIDPEQAITMSSVKPVAIHVSNLPSQGIGRFVASGVSAGFVALGVLFLVLRKRDDEKDAGETVAAKRELLLGELRSLEDAFAAGDVGPKTYEKERRDLIDAIAMTFVKREA